MDEMKVRSVELGCKGRSKDVQFDWRMDSAIGVVVKIDCQT